LEWCETNKQRLKRIICSNQDVRQLAKDGFSVELVAAVLALLESLSLGTAASPLAVLLCKRGLTDLCSEVWSDCDDS
jgi:hypothetical protein